MCKIFVVFLRHVHAECDDIIDNMMLERVKNEEHVDYMCSVCRNRDPEVRNAQQSAQSVVNSVYSWFGKLVFYL